MKHLKLFENRIDYRRVIPRDLFNEAKLLKCVGRLCLLIHKNETPVPIQVEYDDDAFRINMTLDGSLTVSNIVFEIYDEIILFKTTYNNKSDYPFFAEYDSTEYRVFDDAGNFDEEFINFCDKVLIKSL